MYKGALNFLEIIL